MANLATTYLGLELKNPLVVGACSLTLDAPAVQKCAAAGAGAVVLKSLFEEQIRLDAAGLDASLAAAEQWHTEVFTYMEAEIGMRYGTREYLQVIRDSKTVTDIPVIASINCINAQWWDDFAAEVAGAGADALELNVAIMPSDFGSSSEEIEGRYVEIVSRARKAVNIPIAVKIGPYFTSLPQLILRLRRAGADGFVLFNRFYRPTIDIENLELTVDNFYSSSSELSPALRWVSLLAGRVQGDFAVSTGVHTGADVVRALLAGATVAQVVSTLYLNGVEQLQVLRDAVLEWMDRKEFATVADFRGRVSQAAAPDNPLFGRLQYIKGLVGLQ